MEESDCSGGTLKAQQTWLIQLKSLRLLVRIPAHNPPGMFENMNVENSSDEPNLPSRQTS